MQALPAANPVANSVAPASPANKPSVKVAAGDAGGDNAVVADDAQGGAGSFDRVLAEQIDAETLRPDLVLDAANADLADDSDDSVEALLGVAGDASVVAQLLASPAALATDSDATSPAGRDSDLIIAEKGTGGADKAARLRAPLQPDDGLYQAIGFESEHLKATVARGADGENAGAASVQVPTAQSQAAHGLNDPMRTHAGLRNVENTQFNPRVIPEPVKSPQWSEALGQRVVWMAKENVQVVYLQVEPPNLGPLEIQLRLSNDQANLMFVSAHSSVRDAISQSLPKLDELLAAGGISLGSVSVDTQSPSQDADRGLDGRRSEAGASAWEVDANTGELAKPPLRIVVGLVDTFA